MPSLPNILYVHSHDTGRWVRPYGYAVRTPNIQRLAEEALVAQHGDGERSLVDSLPEELYSFVGEGWKQEDDVTLLTLPRSPTRS